MTTQTTSEDQQQEARDGEAGTAGPQLQAEVADGLWRQALAEQMVERARSTGVQLAGPDGLLTGITKTVLETALETELADHLGYDKGDPGRAGGCERPQRPYRQDGADRYRPGADCGAA